MLVLDVLLSEASKQAAYFKYGFTDSTLLTVNPEKLTEHRSNLELGEENFESRPMGHLTQAADIF